MFGITGTLPTKDSFVRGLVQKTTCVKVSYSRFIPFIYKKVLVANLVTVKVTDRQTRV